MAAVMGELWVRHWESEWEEKKDLMKVLNLVKCYVQRLAARMVTEKEIWWRAKKLEQRMEIAKEGRMVLPKA